MAERQGKRRIVPASELGSPEGLAGCQHQSDIALEWTTMMCQVRVITMLGYKSCGREYRNWEKRICTVPDCGFEWSAALSSNFHNCGRHGAGPHQYWHEFSTETDKPFDAGVEKKHALEIGSDGEMWIDEDWDD